MIYEETRYHGQNGQSVSILDKEVTIRLTDTDRYKLDMDAEPDDIEELANMLLMAAKKLRAIAQGAGEP